MFEKDEKAIIRKIVELQKAYVSARREFGELKIREVEKHTELGNTTVELKAALKDSRIGDRTIRNMENEIAVFKKKISEMDSDLEFVSREMKRTDAELERLTAQKSDLTEILTPVKSQLQQSMDVLEENEKEMQAILSATEPRKDQKAGLVAEISEKLSNGATDKEQSSMALDMFSMDFGKLAVEREEIKGTYQEREKVVSDLKHEAESLREKCVSMEEVVRLEKKKSRFETEVKELERDTLIGREQTKGLQTALTQKEADLKPILSGKKEKETLVETLTAEVAAFDELAEKAKVGKNKLDESDSRVKEMISRLKKLFSGGFQYELEFDSKMGMAS
jgi:chromosome segregation ATPase